VSGALAERVFAAKLQKAGFVDVWIGEKVPYGIEDAALYPLFTDDLVELMRELIPAERQDRVAISVIARARKP
jgi:arsenite methyltransferase